MRADHKRIRVFVMDFLSIVPYYTLHLAKGLAETNTDVTLGSMTYDLDPSCFKRHGVRNTPGIFDIVGRYRIRHALMRRLLKLIESIINMATTLVRFVVVRPDVVHVQNMGFIESHLPFDFWFLRIARALGIKIVVTVHNLLPHDTGKQYHDLYARLYRSADALICHDAIARDRVVQEFGVPPKRIWIIPHGPLFHDRTESNRGVARRALGITPDQCLVICQGFIRGYKGIPFLLETWQKITASRPSAVLVVAGGGEEKHLREVEDVVAGLHLSRSVILQLRYLSADEVSGLYAAADVAVYPYRQITTSGALMTGLAMRKAIIATDLPAFRQLLESGRNAELVPYGNVDAFVVALEKLADDPELRRRMAEQLPVIDGPSLSWKSIAQKTLACYRSVISNRVATLPHTRIMQGRQRDERTTGIGSA